MTIDRVTRKESGISETGRLEGRKGETDDESGGKKQGSRVNIKPIISLANNNKEQHEST